MRIGTKRVAIAMIALVALITGCGATTGAIPVNVILQNNATDGQAIHILVPGELFDLSNQIAPGEYLSVRLGYERNGSGVEFRAGRSGQVLSTVSCVSQDPEGLSALGRGDVTWDGSGLRCEHWDER